MKFKTVNVTEETKRALDAVIDVTGLTADQLVRISLENLCPGIIDAAKEGDEGDKLLMKAARAHIAHLRYEVDKAFAKEHGLSMEDLGYPDEEE